MASTEYEPASADMVRSLEVARDAQREWQRTSIRHRLSILRKVRGVVARDSRKWAATIDLPQRRSVTESLAAEVVPFADACRFLERNARRILARRRPKLRDRPIWCHGIDLQLSREPFGVVLVIGTWNYPLLLTGVQAIQALIAGNAVVVKPGQGSTASASLLASTLIEAGLDQRLITILDESPAAAQQAIRQHVDKIIFTGSAETGSKVLQQAATMLTPSTMELSGSDAVFVLADADLDRVATCLAFGLTLNSSATCIAPRRVFVHRAVASELKSCLARTAEQWRPLPAHPESASSAEKLVREALENGARIIAPEGWSGQSGHDTFRPVILEPGNHDSRLLTSDMFVPVLSIVEVGSTDEAIRLNQKCPYALGASVFGSEDEARSIADRIDAGCVVINDMIAPTADPRVPFGGWNRSGFGVTRGADGLLGMTRIKAIMTQRSRWLVHLDEPTPELGNMLEGYLQFAHQDGIGRRIEGLWKSFRTAMAHRGKSRQRRITGDPNGSG